MLLTTLSVRNVRIHADYSLRFGPNVTLITGKNGTGKTSLLEAIYNVLQGTSFKGGDSEILLFGSPWYRIDAEFDTGTNRTIKFDPAKQSGKKQYEIDGKTSYRMRHADKYPVVLFEPDDMRLISGSPSRRRQFIDQFISQFDPEYALSLRRYERALKQRNILLKQRRGGSDDLFVWDVALSKYGAYIIRRRGEILQSLQPRLKAVYKDVAKSHDTVTISYSYTFSNTIEQRLLAELHQSAGRDLLLGYTSVGPHRHDIVFTLNTASADKSASRGEIRTIVLALKFLEVAILEEQSGKKPIILLDDVFSELDLDRQKALLERFSTYQTIMTSVQSPKSTFTVIEIKE